jgi:hypothetical protein
MKRLLLFGAFALITVTCTQAQTSGPCSDSALPEGVRASLGSQFEEWRIQTTADLDEDYRAAWTSKKASDCPGIVIGKFDGKSEPSYAFLLVPREKGKQAFRFVVLASTGKSGKQGAYSATVLEQDDKYGPGEIGIFRVEPGLQFNEEKFATFKLKTEAIYFETFEKTSWIYFWKHGHYEHIVESD